MAPPFARKLLLAASSPYGFWPLTVNQPVPNSTIGPVSYAAEVPKSLMEEPAFEGENGERIWAKLKAAADLHDGKYEVLGRGTRGVAYAIDETRVLKLTSDGSEATGAALVRDTPDPLGNAQRIFGVWQLQTPEMSRWAVLQERLDPLEDDDPWADIADWWPNWSRVNEYAPIIPENVQQFIADVETSNLPATNDAWDAFKGWFSDLGNYFESIGLLYHDFWHKNLLLRGEQHVAIDFGYSQSIAEDEPDIGVLAKFKMLRENRVMSGLFEEAADRIDGAAIDQAPPPPKEASPPAVVAPVTHKYVKEFKKAAELAGVPESWATNRSVEALVSRESSFRPDAKNPASSAFGLFQLLKSTWERLVSEVEYGTKDVIWQAVGGFRYIKQTYKTPERAKAFWDATMQRDAKLAPADLQKKATYWINKGYVGY